MASHRDCPRVQDAYSLRCMPQVHGAARDIFHFARQTLETEFNSATDNPLVFADTGEVLSGGNFHGAPVALALDACAMAAAHWVALPNAASSGCSTLICQNYLLFSHPSRVFSQG